MAFFNRFQRVTPPSVTSSAEEKGGLYDDSPLEAKTVDGKIVGAGSLTLAEASAGGMGRHLGV